MFISCPLDPALSLMGCVTTTFLLWSQFPIHKMKMLSHRPLRALPALIGCLSLNGIWRNYKGPPPPYHPPPSSDLSWTTHNLAELGQNGLLLAWDIMWNRWPCCHGDQGATCPGGLRIEGGYGESRHGWFTPAIAKPRVYMNVKQSGSRQSLSQTDQKPLKMKDSEHLYISSQGCLQLPRLPTPAAQLWGPLSGLRFDSILLLTKLEEHMVCPEGGGYR